MRYKITRADKSILAEGKYCIEYKNGNIVEITDETYGIMLFEELENVIDFINKIYSVTFYIPNLPGFTGNGSITQMEYYGFSVKKVEVLDNEKYPERISDCTDSEGLDGFYRVMNNTEYIFKKSMVLNFNRNAYIKYSTKFPAKGTVCCNKIRVIEDIDKKIIEKMLLKNLEINF